MKFKLLNRNLWSDYDTYIARKKGYIAEIRTAFRDGHKEYGVYTYFIKKPNGEMKTSLTDNKSFTNFNECCEFIIEWINKELKGK